MTPGLLVSRHEKLKLAKSLKTKPTPEKKAFFVRYRNIYNKLIRRSKRLYFFDKFEKNAKNCKKTWETLNEALNKKKGRSKVESLLINEEKIFDQSKIANEFNDYFATIGNVTAETVNFTNHSFREFLEPPCENSFFMSHIFEADIIDALQELEDKKSTDINDISINFLKKIQFQIARPLHLIFNLSIEKGIFPKGLKISKTVPVFKKSGSSEEMKNYRPISMINAFSKILEKIIAKRLLKFLCTNDSFFKDQFGFLEGRSTEHAVLKVLNFITNSLNDDDFCLSLYLDIRKAFDTINHSILLSKMENLGIRGIMNDWFSSYLAERSQKVKVDDSWSENVSNINISVLQGSILGVLLFLIFINDIWRSCAMSMILFADDSTGLLRASSVKELESKANKEIKKLAVWFRANKLALSFNKCNYIIFSPFPKRHQPIEITIKIDDNDEGQGDPEKIIPINRVSRFSDEKSVRLLGIYIDEDLNFIAQADQLISKLSSTLFLLNQLKHFLPIRILKLIYFAHFHSYLNYCSHYLPMLPSKTFHRIRVLQKKQ